ncbi:trans-sialidase, putative, partial [Trypanosoma cruzi marinkellei]
MVSIDGVPKEGSIPVMGLRAGSKGENNLWSCHTTRRRTGRCCAVVKRSSWTAALLGAEKTQHVVILVRNGNQSSAYVDGKRVGWGCAMC